MEDILNSIQGKLIVGLSAVTLSYLGLCIKSSIDERKLPIRNKLPKNLSRPDLPSGWMTKTQYGFDVEDSK